jgi:hypothetical protein
VVQWVILGALPNRNGLGEANFACVECASLLAPSAPQLAAHMQARGEASFAE